MKLLSLEPESSASANSAIPAGTKCIILQNREIVKRFFQKITLIRVKAIYT